MHNISDIRIIRLEETELIVNKMPIVLIFPVVKWYNIFGDYLFSFNILKNNSY